MKLDNAAFAAAQTAPVPAVNLLVLAHNIYKLRHAVLFFYQCVARWQGRRYPYMKRPSQDPLNNWNFCISWI